MIIKKIKYLQNKRKIKNLLKPDNWWILILSGVIAYMLFMIYSEPEYNKAFNFIRSPDEKDVNIDS